MLHRNDARQLSRVINAIGAAKGIEFSFSNFKNATMQWRREGDPLPEKMRFEWADGGESRSSSTGSGLNVPIRHGRACPGRPCTHCRTDEHGWRPYAVATDQGRP